MTSPDPLDLLCAEQLEDPESANVPVADIAYFEADFLYYFALLSPNTSFPLISYKEARAELIDWIFKVASALGLTRETAHTAAAILDKTLVDAVDRRPCSLLLIAMASLFISIKLLERNTVRIDELNQFSEYKFSQKDVVRAEIKCLNACRMQTPAFYCYIG
jgi:hypothetical protein